LLIAPAARKKAPAPTETKAPAKKPVVAAKPAPGSKEELDKQAKIAAAQAKKQARKKAALNKVEPAKAVSGKPTPKPETKLAKKPAVKKAEPVTTVAKKAAPKKVGQLTTVNDKKAPTKKATSKLLDWGTNWDGKYILTNGIKVNRNSTGISINGSKPKTEHLFKKGQKINNITLKNDLRINLLQATSSTPLVGRIFWYWLCSLQYLVFYGFLVFPFLGLNIDADLFLFVLTPNPPRTAVLNIS